LAASIWMSVSSEERLSGDSARSELALIAKLSRLTEQEGQHI
jgi:hypothetical protein